MIDQCKLCALCVVPLESANIAQMKEKTTVNYFQGLETEILRWFTDDSDFCVSLLFYSCCQGNLGPTSYHTLLGYKKYQQKPQESNFYFYFKKKKANGQHVIFTERFQFYLWRWYPRDTEMAWAFYLSINFFHSAALLKQGISYKEPKMPVEIVLFP